MPQLAVTYSPYLQTLLAEKKYPLDAVEFTPWQPAWLLKKILPDLSGYTFYFHGSNLTSRMKFFPGARSDLSQSLSLTRAKWFSTHLSLLPSGVVFLSRRLDLRLPIPPAESLVTSFIKNVERLKEQNPGIPLLLENMPVEPRRFYKHLKTPQIIRDVLEKTGCGMLLDLPHARIAAEAFAMEPREYIQQLPLDRVVEIHTSGPGRRKDGILMDQHCVMQPEDYDLLRWAVDHTPAQLVTLEYIKDRAGLEEQLSKLCELW